MYEGQWANDLYHGKGTATYTGGYKYEEVWWNGEKDYDGRKFA